MTTAVLLAVWAVLTLGARPITPLLQAFVTDIEVRFGWDVLPGQG